MNKEKEKIGKIIVIEGIEGSGKTTLINELKSILKSLYFTQQPSIGVFENLPKDINSTQMQDILNKDRYNSIYGKDGIISLKNRSIDVVSDRYITSGIVHEYFEFPNIELSKLYDAYKNRFSDALPDLVIYLDIEPQKAIERIQQRFEETQKPISRYENIDTLKTIYEIYNNTLKLIDKDKISKIARINASKSKEDILAEVVGLIRSTI